MKRKNHLLLLVCVLICSGLLPVIKPVEVLAAAADENLALNKPAFASASEVAWTGPEMAVDGIVDDMSRWSTPAGIDDQWFYVDLGEVKEIDRVVIKWQTPASTYQILVSNDGQQWTNVKGEDGVIQYLHDVNNAVEEIDFPIVEARYVKFQGLTRKIHWAGYAFYEFEVYAKSELSSITEGITQIPAINQGDTEIVLPIVPSGYNVTLFGSDTLEVIDKVGKIHTPLVDVNVNLLFEVRDENTNKTTITRNILVTVPGQYTQTDDLNQEPKVIPSLREWHGRTGQFTLTATSRIVINPADVNDLQESAKQTKIDLHEISGFDLEIVSGIPAEGDIYLVLDSNLGSLGEEGYIFDADEYVSIKSSKVKGVFYGTRTALQILKQDEGNDNIPKGISRDYPKYETRGFMLDVARKFYTIDYLRDYVKLMAWYKMNTFQIHLNDDIDTASAIGEISAFRLESTVAGLTSTDHYTKDEFRDLQQLGIDYGVNIIPEIDTPAHSGAFVKIRPDLGSVTHLDIKNPESLIFVKELLDEYLDPSDPVFIGPDIHIGMDEYSTATQDDIEAFRKYTNDVIDYINTKGKHPYIWGGLKKYFGVTPINTNATMHIWNVGGYGGAQQAIDYGFDIVNADSDALYIVPTGYIDYVDPNKLYNNWEPNIFQREQISLPYGHPKLKGGIFSLWNDKAVENGLSMHDSHDRAFIPMQVLAEKMWSGTRDGNNYTEFKNRATKIGEPPNVEISHNLKVGNAEGKVIEYTFEDGYLDGSGNGFNGEGTNVTITDGRFGNGVRFNGGTSYIKTPLNALGFGWTASMWIKPDEDNPNDAVIMESPVGQLKLRQGDSGKLGFTKENYHNSFNYELPIDKWTHIVLTGDNVGVTLHVNGNEYVEQLGLDYLYGNHHLQTFVLPIEKIGSETNSFKGVIDNLIVINTPYSNQNYAFNRTGVSSDLESDSDRYVPGNALDGSLGTRWSSANQDDAWFTVDLEELKEIEKVIITWQDAYAEQYKILVSDDNVMWENVLKDDGIINGSGGMETITFNKVKARYVKFQGVKRLYNWAGYSFYEFEVYGPDKMSEYKELIAQAESLLALNKGNSAIRNQMFSLLNKYPYHFESSINPLNDLIAALQESIDNGETTPTAPAAPTTEDIRVTQPAVDTAVGQTLITIGADLEFRVISESNAEKQAWTSGTGEAQKTLAAPALIAGDKIEVRVKATDSTPASEVYTYIVAANNIGKASTIVTPPFTDPGSKPEGDLTLVPGQAGTVSLNKEISIAIPSGATDKMLHIVLKKITDPSALVSKQDELKLISSVIEVANNLSRGLKKPAELSLFFDSSKLTPDTKASLFVYDEQKKEWIEIGGDVSGNTITAEVDRFGTFAVFAVKNSDDDSNEVVAFVDVTKHWAEASIQQAVALGFINGYPDGTFRPNAEITRAEFIVMLAKALKLQGRGQAFNFSDQADIGQWATQAIAQAVEAGIINGYTDGTFRPNAKISRTEMVLMAVRALKLNAEVVDQTSFKDDADIPQWAKASIEAAVKQGLVNGVGANRFAPNHTATRAESVMLLLKAFERRS